MLLHLGKDPFFHLVPGLCHTYALQSGRRRLRGVRSGAPRASDLCFRFLAHTLFWRQQRRYEPFAEIQWRRHRRRRAGHGRCRCHVLIELKEYPLKKPVL